VSPTRADVPGWVADMERPFRPLAEIIAEAEGETATKATAPSATGQGRNRAAATYRNRAMTTKPGREG
jgi:hypothetical protein